MDKATIKLLAQAKTQCAPKGAILKDWLGTIGVVLRGSCGGKGVCRECEVFVDGELVQACKYLIESDAEVFVPERSLVPTGSVLGGEGVHGHADRVSATRVAAVFLAIDIGTTTVAMLAKDKDRVLWTKAEFNPQIALGDDVVSRIIYTEEQPDGLDQLRKMVVSTINRLINAFRDENPGLPEVARVCVSGNTTMLWALLGRDLSAIRRERPEAEWMKTCCTNAARLGFDLRPEIGITLMPQISAFVGGDVVASILSSRINVAEEITLLLDLGTNGEMVLGNSEWMVTTSCSVGPAFEGGGIGYGVPAVKGAIERVRYCAAMNTFEVRTIADKAPIGVCGSGLLSAFAEMFRQGIIDRGGRFNIDHPAVSREKTVVLADSADGPIFLAQHELDSLMRAKAAVYAGICTLLSLVGIDASELGSVLVAGGFGAALNVSDALEIGLLPALPEHKYRVIGNASLLGAAMCAENQAYAEAAERLAKNVTLLDLNREPLFMQEYIAATFLPHTDTARFSGVRKEPKRGDALW